MNPVAIVAGLLLLAGPSEIALAQMGASSRNPPVPPALNAASPSAPSSADSAATAGRNWKELRTWASQPLPAPTVPAEAVPPVRAEVGPGTTLEDVTRVALSNSPTILEAANQLAAARGRAIQAGLYPNPTFGSASPQLAGNQSQYNAYVIQDLVTMGKIRLDASAADQAARQAELALVRARFDVLTSVRQRFYSALAAQQRVEVLGSMVGIARSARDIGQRLLQAEVGTKGNVLLLDIELSKSQADLANAQALAETSKRQLAAATGIINLQLPRLDGDLRQPLPDYEMLAVQQGVLARNALAQRAAVEIARSQIVLRRAEVEPFPNINMMGGYQNQQPGAMAPETQGIYQAQVVIPLFNRNQGNIRAAQATVGAATAQLNRVRTELANDTAAALGRYLVAQQLAQRYEQEILPAAVQVQSISARMYKEGQADFLLYLNAQRALLDANLSRISAQEARWMAGAELAGLLQSEQFP